MLKLNTNNTAQLESHLGLHAHSNPITSASFRASFRVYFQPKKLLAFLRISVWAFVAYENFLPALAGPA